MLCPVTWTFDSFGMAPWDAGGMHGDCCQLHEALRTMMLQWFMRLLCRPVIMHGLDRTMTMNTENGLDTIMMITTDSPRLAVTPAEWYASGMLTMVSHDLRQRNGAMFNSSTEWGFPQVDSAAADIGAVELDDLIFRRMYFPPKKFAAGRDTATAACGTMKLDDMIFRRTNFPPDEMVYMAELGDWPVSVRSTSDWVTPLQTSPRTSLFSLLRECGSDAGLSLSNDSCPNYA